jgi:hypothetical protein
MGDADRGVGVGERQTGGTLQGCAWSGLQRGDEASKIYTQAGAPAAAQTPCDTIISVTGNRATVSLPDGKVMRSPTAEKAGGDEAITPDPPAFYGIVMLLQSDANK